MAAAHDLDDVGSHRVDQPHRAYRRVIVVDRGQVDVMRHGRLVRASAQGTSCSLDWVADKHDVIVFLSVRKVTRQRPHRHTRREHFP